MMVMAPSAWREHDHGGVEVAGLADGRIDPHGTLGVHLDDLAPGHEPGHVEVVDGHVAEDPARHLDVGQGRRRRVAAGDAHQVHVADVAVCDPIAHLGVAGVEAPVEADHERDAAAATAARPRSTSARSSDTGFSQKMGLPAPAAATIRSTWVSVELADGHGVDVVASDQLLRRRGHVDAELEAGDWAASVTTSYTTGQVAPGTRRGSSSACIRPIRPLPSTPTRSTGEPS